MNTLPGNRPAPDRWPVLVFAAIVLAAALAAVAYYGERRVRREERFPAGPPAAEREREFAPEFAPELAPRAAPRAFAARETIRVAFWNIRDLSVGSRDQDEREIIADILDEFDAIAIAEVNDSLILEELEAILDGSGIEWESVTSAKVGRSPRRPLPRRSTGPAGRAGTARPAVFRGGRKRPRRRPVVRSRQW